MRWRVLRDRKLRILLAGQATNMFGDSAMIIVLGIWVKDLTGSSGAAGVVFLLLAVVGLLAPVTGLVVDRFPRRRVLLLNDLASAALVSSLLWVRDPGDVWVIYLVALGYGCSGQVYRAARGGLLHSMVPTELLGEANGLFGSLNQALRIVGPVVGAAIYAGAGGGAVAGMDIATFLVSAGSYVLLRGVPDLPARAAKADEPREGLLPQLSAGLRHVMGDSVIRRLVLASAIAFTGAGMINVATFALVDQGLHRPAALIGVLGGFQGAGSVIAGLSAGAALRRFGEYATASAGFLLNGAGLAAAATATLPGALLGAGLIGLGLPLVLVSELTLVQRRTARELQGRAIAGSEAIINIPFAAAIGTAAALIATVGFRPIYLSVAASFTVVGLALLPFRAATRPQPPAAEALAGDTAPQRPGDTTAPRDAAPAAEAG
jgi:MFS transporter